MRRVLIVSPHFPPTNAPDLQRVRMSLPYFHEYGWEPVVLAVDAAAVEAPQDPILAQTVPEDLVVHRVSAMPVKWTRRVGLGNVAYRAWFELKKTGDRILRRAPFDLVYFSTTQFVATSLGRCWRDSLRIPFVIDIQDPWRTDYYERAGSPPPPGGWKYRFARWQANRLEGEAWKDAAGFISVSPDYLAQLKARYAWFAGKPAAVIPFGAPQRDFDLARTLPNVAPAFVREPGILHLVSVGAVGPIMRTALEYLFAGVHQLRAAHPELAKKLRFHFIGTSYAPDGRAEASVLPLAESCGVADLVREETARVGYFVAIRTMLEADAIVIPGSDDPAYNPSKIATCFLADKPTLALTPKGSAMHRMAVELEFATVASWPAKEPLAPVVEFLIALLVNPTPTRHPSRNWEQFGAQHTARARTRQQCELFDQAIGGTK